MTFEIEITFTDNSIQYCKFNCICFKDALAEISTHLDFLTDLDVDLTTIKSIYSYKL